MNHITTLTGISSDNNGMDVLELTSDSKDTLRNVAEMELGFHFNYTVFAPYTPDVISYT